MLIQLTVNRSPVDLDVAPSVSLLEALRDSLRLTGTKE
jgi:aerobic-type carbon monoxide dehydrogenase small subunit (CoxS/CutS family)